MAQASSAQREPSMEEILASIRRIIEDSETGRKEPPAGEAAEEVESFRTELKSSVEPAPAAGGEVEKRPDPSAFERLSNPLHEEEPASAEDSPTPTVANDEGRKWHVAEPAAGPTGAASPRDDVSVVAERWSAAQDARQEPAETERRAIVSEMPGRKVAAAFEELNEALLENRRMSLDQMAEEMLRPMLQDWLDNNLPQLVERLVREEIERIARGS